MSMDAGTWGRDTGTSKGQPHRIPNAVLLDLRKSQGWGRPRLAREMHRLCLLKNWSSPGEENIRKQIYRLETGAVRSPDEFYTRLYCEFYKKTVSELFGLVRPTADPAQTYRLRSHKFVPMYVGPAAADKLAATCNLVTAHGQWFDCHSTAVEPMSDYGESCHLYVWPFGVAMYHLVEDLAPTSLAEVAVWRHSSYVENMAWAEDQIAKLAGCQPRNETYVLGAYWVDSLPLIGPRRDTALRILCVPEVLLQRDTDPHNPSAARPALVEQALLRDGFSDPGIEDFGYHGISTALASWSGVVYQPLAQDRALTEHDLVQCELAVQSVWSYCSYIRYEVECGRDPKVAPQFGWRFLRALRSRLTTERPQETPQHRSLREAIVSTSGLAGHLAQAVEILRDTEGLAQ